MLGSRSRWARWTLGTGVAALAALVLAGANAISAPVAASTYIVQLDEPPLALYGGGIAGLAPTMPAARGTTRLAPASPASVAYLAHLASRQNAVKSTIDASIGRSAAVSFRYRAAFNGLALSATPSEAAQIATLPGVRRVQRDETRQLLTDSGPAWIGAGGIHDGTATGGAPGTKGEGIVVGIIDTGINHDHPSFADVGGDGFNHTNPRTVHFGVCAPLNPVLCNDKLIGMYDFTGTTPFDDNLHGSHTASTVAGNIVDAALVAPTLTYDRRISGVAPHANVIAYKACNSLPAPAGGCVVSATVAAIDQATFDQVDVVNFSIGGASRNPWTDPNALAFLGANAAGVFVAASAGNSGPGATTIGSPADSPWLMSVGASTHDRNLPSQLTDMVGGAVAPPATITGKSVAAGAGPAPIVYAGAPPHNAPLCGAGAADPVTGASASNPFPPGSLAGMIVVCDRGTYGRVAKGSNVKAAGGIGMVLANDAPNGDSLIADLHVLPAVHISFANGQVLKTWLASGTGHTARITGMVEDKSAANGDVMASFSSRGPNPSVPGVVKPDVTAPGVDVYAAFNTPLTAVPPTAPEYGIISGTSMSSPHAAGAAALLRALKPNWTPNQLKSAFMTTGFTTAPGQGAEVHGVLKEDATRAADPFDMGGGRVELRRAARVGLVLDVDPLAFQGADPGLGGDPRRLNLASMANENCQGTCSWTRTVTSVASGSVSWTASTTAPAGASLSVSPASFTLAPGQSQTLTVTATNDGLPANAWRFGAVTLAPASPGVPAARLPVALRAAGVGVETCDIPDATVVTDASGDQIPPGFSGAYDIESLSVSGLYPKLGESANPNIRWKLKVASLAGELPRNTTWRITWTAGTPARTWFVHMNTFQPTGVAFQYGEITTTASTLGAADDGSFAPDGTIKITIAASKVGGTEVGQTLTAVNARTATLVGAAGTGLTVNDDTTANGTYTLRTCAAPPAGPDAVDDTAATTQGEPVTIAVLANDTHPQGEGLTVSAVTQPATGVAALNLDGTITYSPADEFSGSDTFTYTVSDSQGLTDTASVTVTVAPLCPTGSFADDMESGAPGWTTQTEVNEAGEASATWAVTNDLGATSPSNSWFSDATTLLLKDDRLVMPAQELTSSSRLIFWHRFRFEPGFDGGVLEVSTDGGGTWQDILDAGGSFLQGGYDGTIDPDFGSPIAGRAAWTGGFVDAVTAPMTQVSVDVGALAGGGDVLFRFRLVTDPFGVGALPGNGWWIDDVEVSETALSCNEPPTSVDDGASVDQGNSVEIDVLANDSDPDGDPLTIESFTDGTDGTVAVSEGGLVYTHDGSSTEPDSFTYTVSDGRGGTDSATVSIAVHSPAETLESVDAELEVLIEGDRGRSDKLEDVRAKLQTALAELRKSPPSAQAALGAIEGAVGELEAAVASGYLDGEQGTSFLERVTGAGRQLAMQAIDAATARGGDAGKIDEAGRILADGDALRAGGSYKEAVNKYKDALAKAEGAGP
jgi:subtilisin family serine protease